MVTSEEQFAFDPEAHPMRERPLVPIPLETVIADFDAVMDSVITGRRHVCITRDGKPAVVIMPYAHFAALQHALKVLSRPNGLDELHKGVERYRPHTEPG
jgi:prevent-host-death family protein